MLFCILEITLRVELYFPRNPRSACHRQSLNGVPTCHHSLAPHLKKYSVLHSIYCMCDCTRTDLSCTSIILQPGSLSDLKNRSEKVTGRGQILTILTADSYSIGWKSSDIWPVQSFLQLISFKSDRLPAPTVGRGRHYASFRSTRFL